MQVRLSAQPRASCTTFEVAEPNQRRPADFAPIKARFEAALGPYELLSTLLSVAGLDFTQWLPAKDLSTPADRARYVVAPSKGTGFDFLAAMTEAPAFLPVIFQTGTARR
ncbi:hypothetical protein MY5147_005338 [Beauveria neobassiana]